MKCIPFYGPGWAELGANGDSAQEAKSNAHAGPNIVQRLSLDDAHVPACLAYRRRPSISYCRAMRKMHAHQQMLLHENERRGVTHMRFSMITEAAALLMYSFRPVVVRAGRMFLPSCAPSGTNVVSEATSTPRGDELTEKE